VTGEIRTIERIYKEAAVYGIPEGLVMIGEILRVE